MASKIYVVKKNGEELESVRGLAKAKAAADKAGAEVFDGGKCVYQADVSDVGSGETVVEAADTATVEAADTEVVADDSDTADDSEAEKAEQPASQTTHYRLKALMNVREQPSRNAKVIGTQAEGVLVNVAAIENDWMRLGDGTFILYDNGKFAEKA